MTDLEKWADTSNDALYEIAKVWAKRFTTHQLRGFQNHYDDGKSRTEDDTDFKGLDNMWQCATFAISIREFGV